MAKEDNMPELKLVPIDNREDVDIQPQDQKRGWIFDELMKIGQLEAAMGHTDENVCNIYSDMEQYGDDIEFITKKGDELASNNEIMQLDYDNRVECLNAVFDAVDGSDRHYYCAIKHRSTAFVIAAENWHARHGDPQAEQSLIKAGKSLALTCSLAFGFEPMSCLRCLDEALRKNK